MAIQDDIRATVESVFKGNLDHLCVYAERDGDIWTVRAEAGGKSASCRAHEPGEAARFAAVELNAKIAGF